MSLKVSVHIITFNQEKYIAHAIDSALMQETDFNYEIVIGDDCSTDRTKEIIADYQTKYPNIIKTLFHPNNLGPAHSPGKNNFVKTFKACQGEYIALLEGDDYWTDPLKLQKQVSFMDSHPEFSSCFHWAGWLLDEIGQIKHWNYGPPFINKYYTIDDLLEYGNFIPTCSVVFRNYLAKEYPGWYSRITIGDLPLHILNARKGKIGFIDEKLSVYRRHGGGLYGGRKIYQNVQSTINAFVTLGHELNLSDRRCYKIGLSKLYNKLSHALLEEGKYQEGLVSACKSLKIAANGYKKTALIHILRNFYHVTKSIIEKYFFDSRIHHDLTKSLKS